MEYESPMYKKTLSIANVLYPSLNSSLEGISADIFFYGCNRNCKGCQNPELQEFKEPNHSIAEIVRALYENHVNIVTLMGGEPLDVPHETMMLLLRSLRAFFPHIKINMYTGYELGDISGEVLDYLYAVKTGMYDEDNRTESGSFLASKNQVYWRRDPQFLNNFKVVCSYF